MTFGCAGLKLLKSFESCSLTSYQDIRGKWTIGYGFTSGVGPGMEISRKDAERLLEIELHSLEHRTEKVLKQQPTQNQFDAMICLAYNIGFNAFKNSTLLSLFNAGDTEGASNEFLKWNHVNGNEIAGLTRRREAEKALFLS